VNGKGKVCGVVELIRRYLAVLQKGIHEPGAQAELERIYMEVLRKDPNHRLVALHQMMVEGVSFNIAEQVRGLLAEEITSLMLHSKDHGD
jgi:hypothetical protein